MRRWKRTVGIGAVVAAGAALLVVPAVSQAGDNQFSPRAAADAPDRLSIVDGGKGRHKQFRFQAGNGDPRTPYAFVSADGAVQARRLDRAGAPATRVKTGVSAAKVTAAADTYRITIRIASEQPASYAPFMNIWRRDANWMYYPVATGPGSNIGTADLPPGSYFVGALYGLNAENNYLLSAAFTVTSKAQTVVLAESSAKEAAIRVDDATAQIDNSVMWLSLPNGDIMGYGGAYRSRTFMTPPSVAGIRMGLRHILVKAGSSGVKPTPYRYDLVKDWAAPFPTSLITSVKTASLAKTTTTFATPGANLDGYYMSVSSSPGGAYTATKMRFPATLTEFVTPGVSFSRITEYGTGESIDLGSRTLPAGSSPGQTVGAGPLAPIRRTDAPTTRKGNYVSIGEYAVLGDAAGNIGYLTPFRDGKLTTRLSSGGTVLKSAESAFMTVAVPDAEQQYELDQTVTREGGPAELSTRVDSHWQFRSGFQPMTAELPLIDVSVRASGLDQHNRAAGTVGLTLKATTRGGLNAPAATVDKLEWSQDDGRTWTTLDGASLAVPGTASFVSLRITASNADGGKLTRTLLHAFAGSKAPGDEKVGATTISNVVVNSGTNVIVGTGGGLGIRVTFTATDPSGISNGGVRLWHGSATAPDGVEVATASCTAAVPTATCTATVNAYEVRHSFASNALAGVWRVDAWANAADGTSRARRPGAGSGTLVRRIYLTADATPEPANKNATITVTGKLTRADWGTGTYLPYAGRTIGLQRAKAGSSTYASVQAKATDSQGVVRTAGTAFYDATWRLSYPGDATGNAVISAGDYVDVR
ncbi:hypothetical protein [Actinoplanes solisilvae]|uniref:hypothetical protein n=1 Tax=Actinoplanes solisilvae TaxID=2486853 RepID=UPI000FD818CA|nr:hypothetical protein [Actinoplanes solisilvae]